MTTWVDFKAVKQAVSIAAVLKRYGVQLRSCGKDELRGSCPVHDGGRKEDSFHANTSKNNFQCFNPKCQAKGNVLDLVAALEKCSIRDAALMLQEWFAVSAGNGHMAAAAPATEQGSGELAAEKIDEQKFESESNEPLTFQLKGIDHTHAYLESRGISSETAQEFGVGFFPGKGSMTGRVVIPIHNEAGELVAYAGRAIDGSEPRYKLPAGFHKGQELFNLHRAIAGESNGLIVVEGFFGCMRVWQAGYPFVVALMGCSLSEEQERLLLAHAGMVLLMLDGDEAGQRATDEIGGRLLRSVFVKAVTVPEGKQPDMLTAGELEGLLGA